MTGKNDMPNGEDEVSHGHLKLRVCLADVLDVYIAVILEFDFDPLYSFPTDCFPDVATRHSRTLLMKSYALLELQPCYISEMSTRPSYPQINARTPQPPKPPAQIYP